MRQNLVSEGRVVEEVRKSIADSLRIDLKSIMPENSLVEDLGAESLDFLDINYRLEQTFGIRMARQLVLEHVEEMFGEGSALDEDGRLTEKGAAMLKVRWSDPSVNVKSGMGLDQVTTLITVRFIARGVIDILNSLPKECSDCSASCWRSEDGLRIRCGACHKDACFINGDDLVKEWLEKVQAEKKIF